VVQVLRTLDVRIQQQWDTYMLTDVVQDRSEVEQKRALEERGKALFDAPGVGAEDDCECIADCVNDCDAILAFMEAGEGAEGSTMMGTDVALDQHVDKDVVLGEELHSLRHVGIDTDSSRAACTVKADFLHLSCSKVATAGKALHGVGGGVALCGGVGPMATAVIVDQETGEEALLIDPEGQ
jgi:hypothetical protein